MVATSSRIVPRDVIVAAFYAYCEGQQKALSEAEGKLAADALEECVELRTARYDDWWLRNNYRYRKMRETERRNARHAVRSFIGQLQVGKIELEA